MHPRCFFDALVGTLDTRFGIYIVFVCQISGEICCLKIHRILHSELLNGFHQFFLHLGGAVHGHLRKAQSAAPCEGIAGRLGVIVSVVAPVPDVQCFIAHLSVRICVKQPDRDVNSFDFINMILISEHLRKKFFLP